ncbi:MAG: diaminopimelate decarboxylase [Phycisphaerales bacterium]|nr:diaminopimelate decarboxylase [Phycisphaerales bacterium]
MDHFQFRDSELHVEDVPLSAIAESTGTPTYVYSKATFLEHLLRFQEAFAPLDPLTCFAVKSCSNISVLQLLGEHGAGMDIVSGGELQRALAAGVDPARCVYAGVGKTDEEIEFALRSGIGFFNCESSPEYRNIERIASRLGVTARIALRVNPDVDPGAHRHTTTGVRATKFGIDIEDTLAFFEAHAGSPHCELCGLHAHIGSPVREVMPYVVAVERLLATIDLLEQAGHPISTLDIGGGFAADYETGEAPPARTYAEALVPILEPRVRDGLRIILEPGRSISANAGILLARVQYVKEAGDRRFAILDAGMHTLLRPSHYDAFHFVWPCRPPAGMTPPARTREPAIPGLKNYDVVGPICETGDYIALDRPLPALERGDLIAIFGSGAYGMSMANRYNSMPLPAEVMVDGTAVHLIRRRETHEDLMSHESRVAAPASG